VRFEGMDRQKERVNEPKTMPDPNGTNFLG